MIVTVEGPDNSGKTTLCAILAKRLNALYIKAERPRTGPDLLEYQAILERARAYSGVVLTDRHVAISEPIYGVICRGGHDLKQADIEVCLSRINVVVYCRPDQRIILGTLDNREQMAGVVENGSRIVDAYDHAYSLAVDCRKPRWLKYDYMNNHLDDLVEAIERSR